jgi:MSHA pilin protein MshC
MAYRAYRPDGERGFTMVELVCCIVLLGVLAAVSGSRFYSSQPFEERGYADEVASALRQAQRVAILSGCDVSLTVNAAGYSAMQRPAAGNNCAMAGLWVTPVRLIGGLTLSGTRPASVASAPDVQYIFNARGVLANGAAPALTVGAFTLNVDANSGFVVLQ